MIPVTPRPPETTVLTYAEARDSLIENLRADAQAHEAENYDAIGRRFDSVEHRFPTGTTPELGKLHVALTFWDGWIDARNNGWPRGAIAMDEWPALARAVADDLAADREIGNPTVLARFDLIAHPNLNERVKTLAERLRRR
ncbi:MAG TPA: hypothetical protein VJU87_06995 [Gemmatimonadaceae bacterium]|nr:hypothetical protein [Gemmatimonadaceae bacterium]